MALTGFPFDSTATATEQQWSDFGRMLTRDGVDGVPTGTQLKVTAGAGMSVNIASGGAYIRGMTAIESGTGTLGISSNPSGNPRLDLVVIRINWTANTATYAKIEGTPAPSVSLVEPAPVYSGTTYDLPLAVVRVESGATTLSAPTDRRQFLPLNGITPSTSTVRPNPRGRPMLAYEMDTNRVVSTKDGTVWQVGLGDDLFSPKYVRSQSAGDVTATSYTSTLPSLVDQVLDITFTTGASGWAVLGMGAFMNRKTADLSITLNVSTTTGTSLVGNDDLVIHQTGTNIISGSSNAIENAYPLPPLTACVATMRYKVDSPGLGSVDNRWIKVQPLP